MRSAGLRPTIRRIRGNVLFAAMGFVACALNSIAARAGEADVKRYYENCVNRSASVQSRHGPRQQLVDRAFKACRREEEGLRFTIAQQGNRDSLETVKQQLRDDLQRKYNLSK
jgi:hypothetical protein